MDHKSVLPVAAFCLLFTTCCTLSQDGAGLLRLHPEDQGEYIIAEKVQNNLGADILNRTLVNLNTSKSLKTSNETSLAFENHTDDKEVLLHQNEIELNQTGVTKKYTADVEQELVMYEKKRQDIKKFLLLVNELYERFPRMFRYRLSHVITYRVASVFQPPVLYQDNVAEAYRHAEIASLAKKINSVNNTDPLRYDSSLRDDSYLQDLIVVQIYKVTATKSQVEKNAGIVNSQRTNGEFDDDTILEGSTAVSDDSDESLTSDPSTLEVGLATSTGVDGYLEVLRRRKQDRAILHKLRYRGLRLRNYGN